MQAHTDRFVHDTSAAPQDLGGPVIGIVFASLALLAMLIA